MLVCRGFYEGFRVEGSGVLVFLWVVYEALGCKALEFKHLGFWGLGASYIVVLCFFCWI